MAEKWSERHPDEALRLQAEANRGGIPDTDMRAWGKSLSSRTGVAG